MQVPAAPLAEHQARVRALPVVWLTRKLVKKARIFGTPETVAEDRIQVAFIALWRDGASDWNFVKDPSAIRYLLRSMDKQRKADAKRNKERRTDLDTEKVEESPPSSDRGVVRKMMTAERALWARDELRRRVAVSPLTARVVEVCIAEGEMKASEIAERLGEDVKRVYESLRRIQKAVAEIRESEASA